MAAINEFQTCDADGLLCTLNDQCKGGVCKPGANICECLGDGDCKEDGNLCNGSLYCDKSKALFACVLKPGSVVTCPDLGQAPCSVHQCEPKSGARKRAPCLQKGDCAGGLTCDAAIASCVACSHASHCAVNEACQGGLGIPGTACQSFVPCKPQGQVCSAATGSCVECLQDGDCGGTKVCQGQRSAAAVPCQTDQDCPAVCNLQPKVCADCNGDGDCPGGACGADHMCHRGPRGRQAVRWQQPVHARTRQPGLRGPSLRRRQPGYRRRLRLASGLHPDVQRGAV